MKKVETVSKNKENTKRIKTLKDIANEVISGKWGYGIERITKLRSHGYDYNLIKKEIRKNK